MSFKVEYVKYGIANRFPNNRIEIHEKLATLKYAPIHEELIQHEKDHTDKVYSGRDLLLDLSGFRNKQLYYHFIFTTPSSWVQYSPLYYSKGKWYWDIGLLMVWAFGIFIMGGILFTIL